MNPESHNIHQLERALFHAVEDATGQAKFEVFSHEGRLVLVRLIREATRLAKDVGASYWLDSMSRTTGQVLEANGLIDHVQSGLFFASVQEMKADMTRQNVDIANLTVEDLGLFANPERAIRLTTIHAAKGREYTAVALINLREGRFPHFRADDIEAEKRLFYVAVTRAERVLMYVAERDRWGNPPSRFLGPEGVRAM
jgi:DNA helicase-2/ATP-dependent DNA helicase PcrA